MRNPLAALGRRVKGFFINAEEPTQPDPLSHLPYLGLAHDRIRFQLDHQAEHAWVEETIAGMFAAGGLDEGTDDVLDAEVEARHNIRCDEYLLEYRRIDHALERDHHDNRAAQQSHNLELQVARSNYRHAELVRNQWEAVLSGAHHYQHPARDAGVTAPARSNRGELHHLSPDQSFLTSEALTQGLNDSQEVAAAPPPSSSAAEAQVEPPIPRPRLGHSTRRSNPSAPAASTTDRSATAGEQPGTIANSGHAAVPRGTLSALRTAFGLEDSSAQQVEDTVTRPA